MLGLRCMRNSRFVKSQDVKKLNNFLKRKLLSSPYDPFFIQDISGDRTELRLNTTKISNQNVVDLTNQFANQIANASGSYVDFALNFGNNNIVILREMKAK